MRALTIINELNVGATVVTFGGVASTLVIRVTLAPTIASITNPSPRTCTRTCSAFLVALAALVHAGLTPFIQDTIFSIAVVAATSGAIAARDVTGTPLKSPQHVQPRVAADVERLV